MSDANRIPLRDARDALTDSLGFGLSAPIENLPVIYPPDSTTLTIGPGQSDVITLGFSQTTVAYRLSREACDSGVASGTPGSGTVPLEFDTGTIETGDDFIARICAHKNGFTVPLAETVRVRAGLDANLPARILAEPDSAVRILDTTLQRPYPESAARIVPFGSGVEVRIDNAQSGVDYVLLDGEGSDAKEISVAERGRGSGQHIVLSASAIAEDSVLRVRASRGTDSILLKARLPLKVEANPALALGLVEGPVAEFGAVHQLKIDNSQSSASYQVFARALRDADYEGRYPINIGKPKNPPQINPALLADFADSPGAEMAGFEAITEAAQGTDGELTLALPAAEYDRILLVRAVKQHARENASAIPSSVRLRSPLALLVRPNPAQPLQLLARLNTAGKVQSVSVLDGEPGVYYYLKPEAGTEFKKAAYMHQRNPLDPTQNQGIGTSASDGSPGTQGLAIGIDFAIARDPEAWETRPAISDPPLTPSINTSKGLTADSSLLVRAVRAQTKLGAEMQQSAAIPAIAAISADASEIPAGERARIVATASNPDDRYELWRFGGDQPERRARNGNDADLVFNSDPIDRDTLLLMRVTRKAPQGLSVIRELHIPITVIAAAADGV